MNETPLERALEKAMNEDWAAATAAIDGIAGPIADKIRALIHASESHQRDQRASHSEIRHNLGNAISIALANIDGMVDGAVPVTTQRLQNVGDALRRAQRLLQ